MDYADHRQLANAAAKRAEAKSTESAISVGNPQPAHGRDGLENNVRRQLEETAWLLRPYDIVRDLEKVAVHSAASVMGLQHIALHFRHAGIDRCPGITFARWSDEALSAMASAKPHTSFVEVLTGRSHSLGKIDMTKRSAWEESRQRFLPQLEFGVTSFLPKSRFTWTFAGSRDSNAPAKPGSRLPFGGRPAMSFISSESVE